MPAGTFTPIAARIFTSFAGFLVQSALTPSPGPVYGRRTARATILDARHVIGSRRAPGQLVFEKVKDETLHRAIAISEGPLSGIQDMYLDSQPLSKVDESELEEGEEQPTGGIQVLDADAPRRLAPNRRSKFGAHLEMYEYFAADGTQGAELREAFP